MTEFSCPNLLEAVKDNPAAMAELTALLRIVSELQSEVAQLKAQVAQLSSNSRTSSKPPSSDRHNPNKPQPRSQRRSSGRGPGGQAGHAGRSLAMSDKPDEVIKHPLPRDCPQCGSSLHQVAEVEIQRRQVIEIVPAKLRVIEHRGVSVYCPACTSLVQPVFPEGVNAPVQYGSSVQSLVVYLSVGQLLPCHRLAEVMKELCSCPISAGSVATMIRRAGQGALKVAADIKERILQEPWVGFDETGLSLGGQMHWLHTASSPRWTHLHTHQRRGIEGITAGNILQAYGGRAVHDFLAAYMTFANCQHALCNGHHLRDLCFVHEVLGQPWAQPMMELLVETKKRVDHMRLHGATLNAGQLDRLQRKYFEILEMGYAQNPEPQVQAARKRGRPARGKVLNLLDRFTTHSQEVMAFAIQADIPFDNNHAERDLRMMKTRQKISGCFRAEDLLAAFANIRSVISTAAKHTVNALHAIQVLFTPNPTLSGIIAS